MSRPSRDWDPPASWRPYLMTVFLVIASVFDAWMTLEFIAAGGNEANPVVIPFIEAGYAAFIVWKLGIGMTAGFILYAGCRRRRWVWWAFNAVVWVYLAITALHFWILLRIR